MHCPKCGYVDTKVIDSRPSDAGDTVRRRRECVRCAERFTTYERCELIPLQVIKSDGTRQPFDRNKILNGLLIATIKRDISRERLDELIGDIERELRNNFTSEVSSKDLGDMVILRLLDLDKVAYVRFASVYKDFKDLDEFTSELRNLSSRE